VAPSEALDDRGGRHGAAGAHRDQRGARVAPFELVQRGGDQPGAGGAGQVPEGDRPAVEVNPLLVGRKHLQPGHDGGERLVDLEQVDGSRRGDHPSPELTAELLGFLDGRIAKFKLPRAIDYVAELPRDPNEKLYKRRLRDPYWAAREKSI
jgi:long-chain acyl-CoA synthetase